MCGWRCSLVCFQYSSFFLFPPLWVDLQHIWREPLRKWPMKKTTQRGVEMYVVGKTWAAKSSLSSSCQDHLSRRHLAQLLGNQWWCNNWNIKMIKCTYHYDKRKTAFWGETSVHCFTTSIAFPKLAGKHLLIRIRVLFEVRTHVLTWWAAFLWKCMMWRTSGGWMVGWMYERTDVPVYWNVGSARLIR